MEDQPAPDGEQSQEQPEPPAPPPPPMAQVTEIEVPVTCQGCGSQFKFPVQPNVNGFKFTCTNCNADNYWSKQG